MGALMDTDALTEAIDFQAVSVTQLGEAARQGDRHAQGELCDA